eukprot:503864_1
MDDLQHAKFKPMKKRIKMRTSVCKDDKYYCYDCHQWLQFNQFYATSTTVTVCKRCKLQHHIRYRNTIRGYMNNILHNAMKNAKKRKSSSGDNTRNECKITMDELFEILQTQHFRCKYSAIPMTFTPNTNWRCSIERIDNMKGYIKQNVVLICFEFNSTDVSIKAINQVYGSAQWTREKFEYFYNVRFNDSN